jgi:diguanylate cyclase (GGDEF)-like protein/PAS domain S-box-containing protein
MAPKVLQKVLAAVVCLLMLAAGYTSIVIFQRQAALQTISRYNAAWTVSQAVSEFLDLERTLASYALPQTGSDFDDVQLRLDIMFSRLDTFEAGERAEFGQGRSIRQFVRANPQNEETVKLLRLGLETVDQLISKDRALFDVAKALQALAPINAEMTALASRASAFGAELAGRDRSELARLHLVLSGLTLGLILCGVLLIMLLWRQNKLVQEAHEKLRTTAGKLREAHQSLILQNQRFDAALNNMSQALCTCDANGRLIVFNEQFASMLGMASRTLAGMELKGAIAEVSRGPQQSVLDALLRKQESLIAARKKGSITLDLPDGRSFAVSHEPIADGGWLATYEDVSERRQAEARIFHMAHHDALTKLPNRVLIRKKLLENSEGSTFNDRCDLLLLDLDGFKEVNDTLGHDIGDQMLNEVADRLRSCIGEEGIVGRLGGDEFAVLMHRDCSPEHVAQAAERILSSISEPYHLDHRDVVVGASIGIAGYSGPDCTPDDVLKYADLAMYQSKADGKGRITRFSRDIEERLLARKGIEADLREALSRNHFEVHYQSLHDTRSQQIKGFEALVRWRRQGLDLVSPAEFIPIAEKLGLIDEIGDWVLREACREAVNWSSDLTVAVNFSPMQFRTGNIVQRVIRALSDTGLSPHRLELELTESVLLEASAATLSTLHQLRQLGVRIALDDFGTGYSSLSYLTTFPFDKIKIDRGFVRDMSTRPNASAVIEMIVQLSNKLGMVTTAEGVETEEQLALLRAVGCSQVQGYLLSVPRPAHDLVFEAQERRIFSDWR